MSETPGPAASATDALRALASDLRERAASSGDTANSRIQKILAEAQQAMGALSAPDSGYLHLPEAAEGANDMTDFEREREQLRSSVVALQQERDVLRSRIRELEEALAEARHQAAPAESGKVQQAHVQLEAFDPSGHKKRMGEILVEAGILNAAQLADLLTEQSNTKHKRLGALLVERGITTEEMIGKVLAAQLRLPFVDLHAYQVVDAAVLQLSQDIARRHECVPIDGDLAGITLAMANPLDLLAIENVEIACKRRVSPVVAVPSVIATILDRVYGMKP